MCRNDESVILLTTGFCTLSHSWLQRLFRAIEYERIFNRAVHLFGVRLSIRYYPFNKPVVARIFLFRRESFTSKLVSKILLEINTVVTVEKNPQDTLLQ